MRQNKIQKTTNELIDRAIQVIVAITLIFVVFKFAESLVGQIPTTIGFIILGLAGVFIFATNKKIRQEFSNWGK
jgi:ascorbate-specific PTS system EIIC-type component UlaA